MKISGRILVPKVRLWSFWRPAPAAQTQIPLATSRFQNYTTIIASGFVPVQRVCGPPSLETGLSLHRSHVVELHQQHTSCLRINRPKEFQRCTRPPRTDRRRCRQLGGHEHECRS